MALFKDTATGSKEFPPPTPKEPFGRELDRPSTPTSVAAEIPRRSVEPRGSEHAKESVIASDLSIEGKIAGVGHVRIAGKFKGDVHVEGNVAIDAGAQLTGQVRAKNVIVGGELQGNIEGAVRVEVLETGVLVGDVKAGSLTVAAGSRMRGQVEFGWEGSTTAKFEPRSSGTGT